jgi:hypothetical protein
VGRILITLAFMMALPISAEASAIDLDWNVPGQSNSWSIENPGVPLGPMDFGGSFSNAVATVTIRTPTSCTRCTQYLINLAVSGLTLNDITFKGVFYQTIYFSGTLDFTTGVTFFQNGGIVYSGTGLSGSLIGCTDPSCGDHLFSFSPALGEVPHVNANIRFNLNGQPTLQSIQYSFTPEPGSVTLLGTGCLVLIGFARRKLERL